MVAQIQLVRAEEVEDSLPLTDDPTDPIGVDREVEPAQAAAPSGKPVGHTVGSGGTAEPLYGPEPPPFAAQTGEVLTAPASVREHAHRLSVELNPGLASISAQIELENAGEKPAEVSYRLPVPPDAALQSFEVCNEHGCRPGLAAPAQPRLNAYDDAVQARPAHSAQTLPAGDARIETDRRGTALHLRAAKVTRGEKLLLRVTYLTQASVHAGVTRVLLPARGMDPRTAPRTLRMAAAGHADTRVNERPVSAEKPIEVDAWSPLELSAVGVPPGVHAEYWNVPCGRLQCVRAYASASPDKPVAKEIFLAVDASPSTEGAARSRLLAAVAAVLTRAPDGSHVRALRFASQSAPLLAERTLARELALSAFGPIAYEAELGAATRFEAAWQAIEKSGFAQVRGPKLVVIVGDGGLTTGPAKPFEAAKRRGVEVSVVNVADRHTTGALVRGVELTGGAVIEAGREADAAVRGAAPEPLEERVAALFQPSRGVLHAFGKLDPALSLRAGDSVLWEAALSSAPALTLSSRPLSRSGPPRLLLAAIAARVAGTTPPLIAVDRADLQRRPGDRPEGQDQPPRRGVACDRRGPARRVSGLSPDDAPVQLAQERAICAIAVPKATPPQQEDEPELGAGMPGSPLLSMLRQRIVPVARGCFRRDRAGRPDYQVRAEFVFELADREVVSATVQGKIAQPLRECLLSAIDSLAVPRFTGRVVVRYPLVTEREPLPSQIELTPGIAAEVDNLTKP